MTLYAFAPPILPGKVEAWREFCREIGEHPNEHAESRRRLGIRRESAWLQQVPQRGSLAVVVWDVEAPNRVYEGLEMSDDPYDRWFARRLEQINAIDLRRPPPMNELGVEWQA